MKEVKVNETVTLITNNINTLIINVTLKVNKLKKCI